jgi:hypothetical protein
VKRLEALEHSHDSLAVSSGDSSVSKFMGPALFVNRYAFGRAVETWPSPLLKHYLLPNPIFFKHAIQGRYPNI